jgi:hypothetical protein
MFSPVEPAAVMVAVGRAARAAAAVESSLDDFQRGQLLSAYSATRHLAAEAAGYPAAFDEFRAALVTDFQSAAGGDAGIAAACDGIARSSSPGEAGSILADLLSSLRVRSDDQAAAARTAVRQRLRALAATEVQLLSRHID